MQEIYIDDLGELIRNKNKIEKILSIKIENKGRLIFIEGSGENEYLGLKIIEAMNLGFSAERALLLKNEEIILQILNIKDITKRSDLERVRARIIGTHGKTLNNLKKLTSCYISIKENQIGIIGNIEDIEYATRAIISLIQGSKQGSVYARLEKDQKRKKNPEFQKNIKNEFKKKNN